MSDIPHEPPRRPQLGFLYLQQLRVQGISIAGEESFVQIPELDLCFDIGRAPKAALSSNFVALTHGHMDHAAGLAYYYSQRHFQGMGVGTVLCHPTLAGPIQNLMRAWIDIEGQRTPFTVTPMEQDGEVAIKNNLWLRAFDTNHTVPSLGFVALERRSKLKPEFAGLPQEKLIAIKKTQPITQVLDIPLVCYTGDTAWGGHFDRDDVLNAKILITECTFLEPGHRSRANVGKHLHLDDIVELLGRSKAEAVVLTHLSRRTHMGMARKYIEAAVPEKDRHRVFILMDSRTNRARLESLQATPEATPEATNEPHKPEDSQQ
jgi:ribonuclease Z